MDGIKFPKVLKFNGHVARSLKSVYHLLSGLIIAMMSSYLTLVDANQFGPLGYLHNELETYPVHGQHPDIYNSCFFHQVQTRNLVSSSDANITKCSMRQLSRICFVNDTNKEKLMCLRMFLVSLLASQVALSSHRLFTISVDFCLF